MIEAANPQAFEAYLRARHLINRRGREAIEAAVTHLERALRLDNHYAPAHAQLAIAIALLLRSPSSYGDYTLEEVKRGATPHIQTALELVPDLAEAHGAQALLALNSNDGQGAIEHANRALELNASYIDAMNWRYLATSLVGRYADTNELMRDLLAADPLSIVGQLNYAGQLAAQDRIDEAHQVADRLLQQFPWAGYTVHGSTALNSEGKVAEGLSWLLYAYSTDPTDTQSNWFLSRAFIYLGEYDEARRVSDDVRYLVEPAEGNHDEAISTARRRVQSDPENYLMRIALADTLHQAGRIEEAQPFYEELAALNSSRPLSDPFNATLGATLRLALGRRAAADETGAAAAADMVRRDQGARAQAGLDNHQYYHQIEAMLAAFDGNRRLAAQRLRQALAKGFRNPEMLREPIFDAVRDDPDFVALQNELAQILTEEHAQVLQLICNENPVPDAWQPLPETCRKGS